MRIKCIVKYDGTNFHGWQVQNKYRTVQGEIQKAIKNITSERIRIHGSGRTDRKVHAVKQVFHFDTTKELPAKQWKRAINHFLPNDTYILDSSIVDEDFHSRYSATSKEYHYYLSINEYDPIQTNYIYQYGRTLDIEEMIKATKVFLGEHDFASYCTIDEYGDTIREITSFEIEETDGIIKFKIKGNGFRRYMVRLIVGGVIQVGAHRMLIEDLQRKLDSKGEEKCLHKAKPQGLYLYEVLYE